MRTINYKGYCLDLPPKSSDQYLISSYSIKKCRMIAWKDFTSQLWAKPIKHTVKRCGLFYVSNCKGSTSCQRSTKTIYCKAPAAQEELLGLRIDLLTITIVLVFCSHTILQKSSAVSGRGPWVAM